MLDSIMRGLIRIPGVDVLSAEPLVIEAGLLKRKPCAKTK